MELVNFTLKTEDLSSTSSSLGGRLSWTSERFDVAEKYVQEHMPNDQKHLLLELRERLDECIKRYPSGAFVKLSSRSPKDSPLFCDHTIAIMKEMFTAFPSASEVPLNVALNDEAIVFARASVKALRVCNGEEAMKLITRSTRVYSDLTLARVKADAGTLAMKMVVREFCDSILPEWEFRVWVANGKLTGATQYHSDLYVRAIHQNQVAIQDLIKTFFETVHPTIPCSSYTMDLALSPDMALSGIRIVEINPPPPIAGGCLYNWDNPSDTRAAKEGPYQLRVVTEFSSNPLRTMTPPLKAAICTLRGRIPPEAHTTPTADTTGWIPWLYSYCNVM
ncbi:hypothetical protein Pelo_8324 [Pelomyxa schiedti]|nr:hypothetical protein Pelo_8324 [Pelomyxa schiedti]